MNRFQTSISAAAVGVLFAFSAPSIAATKADYSAAKDRAEAAYKTASDACKSLAGNPKDVCVAEAKAARTKSEAMAEADYKNTPKAHAEAMESVADADYDVAKQRCDAKTGNEKDVCVKEAKAVEVKTKADAKASLKTADARHDAADDKRDANYKVAMEKCDAFAGAAKDNCQSTAKSTYGK
ncbi:MAG: hypothetical protein ABI277_00190 [Burkholderiaceae bacterium]